MTNELNNQIAGRLEEVARILQEERVNHFRVEAYLKAARSIRQLDRPITEIVSTRGIEGLRDLPGIGEHIARSIYQLVTSGRLPMLERLRSEHDPIAVLCSVPGIGPVTARRLHDLLRINSLEELEAAAHDGRLQSIAGLGAKRVAGIRDSLTSRLSRVREIRSSNVLEAPPVAELLDVDGEYRSAVEKDSLPKIAPKRFNPAHQTWLPILHTIRGNRSYTALFSNTARANRLGRTRDWVVIYFDGANGQQQCTAVTARNGPLKGKRIIRGREQECATHYLAKASRRAA